MKSMHFFLALVIVAAPFAAGIGEARALQTSDAEKIVAAYMKDVGIEARPDTEKYASLMKGILLGEHPKLLGDRSTYARSVSERDAILTYVAEQFGRSGWDYAPTDTVNVEAPAPNEEQRYVELQSVDSPSSRRASAISYAYAWSVSGGTRRNALFPDFGADDCTNFVSQAVHAGGIVKKGGGDGCTHEDTNTEWYVNANSAPPLWCIGSFRNWEWSTAWSVPQTYREYFSVQNNFARVPGWTLSADTAEYHLAPGDVVQLQSKNSSGNWVTYHTMIVTSEDSNELYVTYHSNAGGLDEVDKPLSSIPTGSSQRYMLIVMFYPEVYLPVVIRPGTTALRQVPQPPDPYPAPATLLEKRPLPPYPGP